MEEEGREEVREEGTGCGRTAAPTAAEAAAAAAIRVPSYTGSVDDGKVEERVGGGGAEGVNADTACLTPWLAWLTPENSPGRSASSPPPWLLPPFPPFLSWLLLLSTRKGLSAEVGNKGCVGAFPLPLLMLLLLLLVAWGKGPSSNFRFRPVHVGGNQSRQCGV